MNVIPGQLLFRMSSRLLVLACLVFALFPPSLPWTRADLELTVLVDESLSMPADFTPSAWQQALALLAVGPADTELRLIRFAASPVLEVSADDSAMLITGDMPQSLALDGTATDISSALRAALHQRAIDRPSIMLLASDAAATHGDTESALRSVHSAGVPLYLYAPFPSGTSEPFSVRNLQLPSHVNVGDQVPVRAEVSSGNGGKVALVLVVDGQVRERQELALDSAGYAVVSFRFMPLEPGVKLVTVRAEEGGGNSQRKYPQTQTRAVTVLGPAPLLYVSSRDQSSPLVGSLRMAGWEVVSTTPGGLMTQTSQLQRAGTIVLDDLAIDDMSDGMWRDLVSAVQIDGKGLIVLGGAHSFGAGAYRHSALEQILPVTAEAAEPLTPAAVLFLLDKSGSMGREQLSPSRFALARQAVAASAKMLLPGDQLGITAFDTEAEIRLPVAPRQANDESATAALDLKPSGGTSLAPALYSAAEQLLAVEADQRLIVLVTDGFAGDEDLQSAIGNLRAGGVTVIALAVGDDADRQTLGQLTDFNDGRVLSVTDISTLPRLMSREIARERAPAVAESTQPLRVQALPFGMGQTPWPPLSGYMVSKARPGAEVYLQSGRGDPLLASGVAGAGSVVVMPAGLGDWARNWWEWREFGTFLGGLMRWADPGYSAPDMSLSVIDNPGELLFSVDMIADDEWAANELPELLVDDPFGARFEPSLELRAPGRYQGVLSVSHAGLYQVTLHAGARSVKHAIYRNATREFDAQTRVQPRLAHWVERGWIKPWPGADNVSADWPRDTSGWRRSLLLLAMLGYFLLLVCERGLVGSLLGRLRARFSS